MYEIEASTYTVFFLVSRKMFVNLIVPWCRFLIDPFIFWDANGKKRVLDLAGVTKLVLMSGMFSESFMVDNDYKRIKTTGKRALTKKTALYVKPEFLENLGSQRIHTQGCTIQRYYKTKVLWTKVLFRQRYYKTKVLFGTKNQPILKKSQYLRCFNRRGWD